MTLPADEITEEITHDEMNEIRNLAQIAREAMIRNNLTDTDEGVEMDDIFEFTKLASTAREEWRDLSKRFEAKSTRPRGLPESLKTLKKRLVEYNVEPECAKAFVSLISLIVVTSGKR